MTFLAVVTLTLCVILFAPRKFTSEARLMLRIGRESVTVDPTASTVGETLNLHHTRENEIQSALGVMQSREIIERVVDEVGEEVVLRGKPVETNLKERGPLSFVSDWVGSATGLLANIDHVPDRQKAIRKLARGVYLNSQNESSVVSVAYSTDSPEVAQSVIASWVANYVVQHAKANHTEGSLKFFEEQGNLLRSRLEVARANLEKAKSQSNLVTVDGQQKLLEAQLAKIRDGLVDVDGEIETLRSRIDAYSGILSQNSKMITTAVTGKSNEARDLMRDRLFALEVLQKDLESKFKTDHPRLVSIRNQIDDAQQIVADQESSRDEVTEAINPAYQQLSENKLVDQAALAGLLRKQQALTEAQDRVLKEIASMNATERTVRSIENELVILEGRYSESAVKMEQARMDDVLAKEQITSVNIVQPASLEVRPISPNKPFCAVAGFFSAIAMAIGMPILLEMRKGRGPKARVEDSLDDWGFEQREKLHNGDHPLDSDEAPGKPSKDSLQPIGS